MESISSIINKCTLLERSVFCKICSDGPLSKPELLKKLNLKHATLSRAADALLEKGLLIQKPAVEPSGIGRKPRLLYINPASFYIIGIDISRMYLGIILLDASLNKIEYSEYKLSEKTSPDYIINKIIEHVPALLNKYKIDKSKLLGLGIGAVGKISKDDGIIEYADNFGEEWSNIHISKILNQELGINVTLENGANAAAYAELMLGAARNYKHILYVSIGVGVRCGVINEGRIVQNINNIDSTYGHIVVEPSGKKCTCGNYGCVAAYSTSKPIIQEYKRVSKLQCSHLSMEAIDNLNFKDIVAFSEKGDQTANGILTNAAVYMGIGLANIVSILNPEAVVLGGYIIENSEFYYNKAIEIAKSRIYKMADRNIIFTKSHLEKEATATGICAIITEHAFKSIN